MTYTTEIRDGHHIVDMAPQSKSDELAETMLEVLKYMTGEIRDDHHIVDMAPQSKKR